MKLCPIAKEICLIHINPKKLPDLVTLDALDLVPMTEEQL